jgi:phospholipase/lecithinase/hemolysin
VADPALFGFSDVTNPCWSGDFFGVGGSLCGATIAQQNTHLFWDAVHPTELGHAVLADAALRLVPEPGSMTLLASGLVCLALRCRRRA